MNCPKCSISLPNNLLLCPACGHNLRSSTTPPQASGSSPVLSPSAPHGPAGPPQQSGHTQNPVNPTIPFVAAPAGFWLRVAAYTPESSIAIYWASRSVEALPPKRPQLVPDKEQPLIQCPYRRAFRRWPYLSQASNPRDAH